MCFLVIKGLKVMEINSSIPVLNNINIKIKRNQIVALIGESGAGKSLLARSITGLLPQNLNIISGEFYFCGEPVTYNGLKKKRGKTIFYSPQNAMSSLNPSIKIKNQINDASHIDLRKMEAILLDLDLTDPGKILNSYAFELSEGENQRCLLAMAIAINPEFLILDEPTASLDFTSQRDFITLLKKIHAKYHMTLLVISHNVYLIKEITDYIYIMNNGIIVDAGTLSSLFSSPSHEYTKEIACFL